MMRFLPYGEAALVPNVIVDGAPAANTVLTLSHWPKSGTPAALKRDTSAEIVFAYLDAADRHVHAEAVSNNHFDEDGLVGMFALVDAPLAVRHRDLLVDVAQAGDFGVFARRDAARIAFAIAACAEAGTSPLPPRIFELPHADLTGELYVQLIELLPRLLTNLNDHRALWEGEDARLATSEELIERGIVTIEEQPELDLAVVRMPDHLAVDCHPFALHSRTRCSRMLMLQGDRVELQYRYEGWVQMASRRPAARVDLSALAGELNAEEKAGARWIFDGVDRITPRLHLEGATASSIPATTIVNRIDAQLRTAPPAWNPYDEQ
jgi:hypothetical protein